MEVARMAQAKFIDNKEAVKILNDEYCDKNEDNISKLKKAFGHD